MKNRITQFVFLLFFGWMMVYGITNSAGKSGKTGAPGENNCTQCHAGVINSNGGNVVVSGIANSMYQPGQTYTLSVTVTDAASSLFGFSAVVLQGSGDNAGSLTAGTDNHTESLNMGGFLRNYVTHNTNGGATAGSHTFSFSWTAPATDIGNVTIYVTANAANGNGGTSGDHIYSTSLTLSPQQMGGGEVVINEADVDQPQVDNAEFIELYGTPGMSLNGYTVVLFNGNGDISYGTYDLTGYSLDAFGYFVMGSVPNANLVIPSGGSGFIQNGADAIGLYLSSPTAWPNGTPASNVGLVDALVYGTADAQDAELIAALAPTQTQVDEGAGNNTNSMSRVPNGGTALDFTTYIAQSPSPGASNVIPVNITFQVDMTGTTVSPSGVFLAGSFQGWNSTANPMTDSNADNIYEVTIALDMNQTIQYKFLNGAVWESVDASCGISDGFGGFNRVLDIGVTSQTLPVVCINSCNACIVGTPGCTNPSACNFDPASTIDDGSCLLVGAICDDGNVNTINDLVNANCVCAGTQSGTTYNITFQVDMNSQTGFTTPEINGTFNSWCGSCAPMSDANGDGIWEITIPLLAGNYEYKFSADSWAMQENLIPGSACTITNGNFTNRSLVVTGDAVLPVVCWGACVTCDQVIPSYNVTFLVDMTQQTGFTTPELNGSFNNWCGNCTQMSDANGDGIWEVTLNLQQGSYEYKFSADNWATQESLTAGSSCTITTGSFTNRILNLQSDTVLTAVCWGTCVPCGQILPSYDVTFVLDMSQQTGFTTPEVNGTFNNWCGNCNPMTDANGDGIWETTLTLEQGTYEYKFSTDNWTGQESLNPGDICTVTNNGFTNRSLNLTSSVVLGMVCYGSCSACFVPVNGCTNTAACNYNAAANVEDGSCLIIGQTCDDQIANTINDVITDNCVCAGDVIVNGCTNPAACNFNVNANVDDASCLISGESCDDANGNTINDVINASCQCAGEIIVNGCTDVSACNYNANANVDDASCLFVGAVCDDANSGTMNDVISSNCQCVGTVIVGGCTNAAACNFEPLANMDNGSCILVGDVCDDGNSLSTDDVISPNCVCLGIIPNGGCTNNQACNFDAAALVDDGSCLFIGQSCNDGDILTMNDTINGNCVCLGVIIVNGCTNPLACNYNSMANVDNGSCLIIGESCDDGNANTMNDVISNNCQCAGMLIVNGCTNAAACNFDAAANVDDGSCLLVGQSCDDNDPFTMQDSIGINCTCVGMVGNDFVVINEVDVDQPALDNAEFIELYGTPNMSLDGFSVVLFNGNNDLSYAVYDLDGYQMNANGFFVLGAVANADYSIPAGASGFLQNGADAVVLVIGDSTDWVAGTPLSNAGLVDAVVYGTADPADLELLAVLTPNQTQLDEGAGNNTNSLSRVPDGGSPLTLNLFVAQGPTPGVTNVVPVLGCTNAVACNFDPLANTDDGSCQLIGSACDDGNIQTINDVLDANCACTGTAVVAGCMNVNACNYNALAVVDDGSCLIIGAVCDDGNLATINDVVSANCECGGTTVVVGCTIVDACNYNASAVVDDGSCIVVGDPCNDGNAQTINDVIDVNCNCMGMQVAGQVVINEVDADQPGADAAEFIELYGTPEMSLSGYSLVLFNGNGDTTYNVFDLDGYQLDVDGFFVLGSVLGADYFVSSGTTGFLQNGADAVGLFLADSIDFPTGTLATNLNLVDALVYGTTDPDDAELIGILVPGQAQVNEGIGNNTNSSSRVPDGGSALTQNLFVAQSPTPGFSNVLSTNGCTDPAACNYDIAATVDDGSCLIVGSSCDDGNAQTINDTVNAQCQCAGVNAADAGCTDANACNYDATATVDDGSCILPGDACDDGNAATVGDVITVNCECMGVITQDTCLINPVVISLDSVAHNLCFGGNEGYISTTVSGGSGLYLANWNSNPIQTTPYAANLVAGIYSLVIEDTNGCTDTLTQEITQPEGSFPVISGNFDPTAMANEQYTVNTWPGASYVWTVNGGSILSGDSTETMTVIWNNINTGTVSVVQTDSTGCVLSDINVVYVNATDIVENQDSYQMYPNPANQYTSFVWGNQKLRRYEVSDAMGRRILSQSSAADFYQLDVSEWEAGLYFVRITDGETEKVEKLIVEK